MKKTNKFRPIGEEFQLDEVTLKVVESSLIDCTDCFFETSDWSGCLCLDEYGTGACSQYYRKDKKSVIFKNVTTNEPNN